MVVRSQSDMNEILRKCDVGALHEPFRHWAAPAARAEYHHREIAS